jgi:hypothetical protein
MMRDRRRLAAVSGWIWGGVGGWGRRTKFEFARPYGLGWVGDKVLGEVALDATDHVVVCGFAAGAYDAESVVLHDGCAADATQETLLHAALELDDGHLGRGNLNLDGDFAEGHPWDKNTVDC